jgi:FkbM family methyltransferase
MTSKLRAFYLLALKRLLGKKIISLHVMGGPLRGYRWRFGSRTNNEMILGTWEPEMQDIFSRYIEPGHVVYDLGAHQGFLSALAGKIVGNNGNVYSFEPFPYNFQFLRDNINLNHPCNVTLFAAAVSDKAGTLAFSNSIHDTANTYLKQSPEFNDNVLQVKAVSLDELLEDKTIRPPDFIKIDVEGAELDVLHGAQKLFSSYNPVVYLETHNVHNAGVDQRCLDWFNERGYAIKETIAIKPDRAMCSYVLMRDKIHFN